jgi:uncharacterized membrane protein
MALMGKNKTITSLITFAVIAVMLVFALFVKFFSTLRKVGSDAGDAIAELFFVMDGSTFTWYLLFGSLILMIVMASIYAKKYIAEKNAAKVS